MLKRIKGTLSVLLTAILLLSNIFGTTAFAETIETPSEEAVVISAEETELNSSSDSEESQTGQSTEETAEESSESSEPEDSSEVVSGKTSEETDIEASESSEEATESSEEVSEATEESSDEQSEEAEESEEPSRERAMVALDDSTVIVYSFEELSTALSNNNGYTYIYLGADITQTSSTGITVNSSKASVVIDGFAPDATTPATFTQYSVLSMTSAIYVANSSTTSITFQNANLVGKNYYGIVASSDSYSTLSITYNNISYTGPQIAYNSYGTVNFIDSNIALSPIVGLVVAQETAEAARISFSGNVTISSSSTTNSIFWLKGTSTSMTLNSGASVNISSSFYFLYSADSYPTLTLNSGSSLSYTGKNYGMHYDAQQFGSVYINSGASLSVTQNTNSYSYGTMRVRSLLQMEDSSSLTINRGAGGTAIQFTTTGARAVFNNPQRVKLYSPASTVMAFTSVTTVSITTDAINLWTTSSGLSNNSIDNSPTYMWNKSLNQPLTLEMTYSGTTRTVSTNLDSSDPTSGLTGTTFNPSASQMLVFGKFNLNISEITNLSTAVSGVTESDAEVRVSYPSGDSSSTAQTTATSGVYTASLSQTLSIGDIVSVLSYNDNLNKIETSVVVEGVEEILRIVAVPENILFGLNSIPEIETTISRQNTDELYVEIEDTRSSGSWNMYASLDSEMQGTDLNGALHSLSNSLLFTDESGNTTEFSAGAQRLIYSGSGNLTNVWTADEGILFSANPSEIYSGVTYTATITWSLQDTP